MKMLKRFLTRGNSENDIAPQLPTATPTNRLSLPPSSGRGKSTPKLTPAPVTVVESKRKQDKRQQKIQQFLNNNSLARRTWEGTDLSAPFPKAWEGSSGSAPFTTSAPTVATESSSSSSINSMTEEDDLNASAPALLEDQHVRHITLDNSSSNNEDDVTTEDKTSSSLLSSSSSPPTEKKTKKQRRRKLISWDTSVEIDQSKRELTRQFRSTLPEWKQRQMAHRVHHCNARKAPKEESSKAEPQAPQEIAVTPAAEGWFERCDRDISAEYLQNIDLVFANSNSKSKSSNKTKKISSGKSVDCFTTTTTTTKPATKGYTAGGNRSVASF